MSDEDKLAYVLFKTDWPKDNFERFGPKDHARLRYVEMAKAAIVFWKQKESEK